MVDGGNSLINLGDLSKPADTLIQRVSDAVGGIFKPFQIRRVAKAEIDAEKIRALGKIEISEIEQRGLLRLIQEEGKKQENIEKVTALALPLLADDAKPENLRDEWLVDFFEKVKLVSDSQVQEMWAKILAGEASRPGTFCKRTIQEVSLLEKADGEYFRCLCQFIWNVVFPVPLVFDFQNEIYKKNGVNFGTLLHLESIGLIQFSSQVGGFSRNDLGKTGVVTYKGVRYDVTLPDGMPNIDIGKVNFTKVGAELATIADPSSIPGFEEYVLGYWEGKNIKIKKKM